MVLNENDLRRALASSAASTTDGTASTTTLLECGNGFLDILVAPVLAGNRFDVSETRHLSLVLLEKVLLI